MPCSRLTVIAIRGFALRKAEQSRTPRDARRCTSAPRQPWWGGSSLPYRVGGRFGRRPVPVLGSGDRGPAVADLLAGGAHRPLRGRRSPRRCWRAPRPHPRGRRPRCDVRVRSPQDWLSPASSRRCSVPLRRGRQWSRRRPTLAIAAGGTGGIVSPWLIGVAADAAGVTPALGFVSLAPLALGVVFTVPLTPPSEMRSVS